MKSAASIPIRLDTELVEIAKREGGINKRSAPKQIEYWAELGKAVESVVDLKEAYEIIQGFMKLKVESVESNPIDSQEVFNSLEEKRKSGELSNMVTASSIYFEASKTKPGLLDKVNLMTGERQTGQFHDGKFESRR